MKTSRSPKSRTTKKSGVPKKPAHKSGPGGPVRFPEVKGKTLESVEVFTEIDEGSIVLIFTDQTVLQFDLELAYILHAEYSDWKTHNWRGIKKWPPLASPSSWR